MASYFFNGYSEFFFCSLAPLFWFYSTLPCWWWCLDFRVCVSLTHKAKNLKWTTAKKIGKEKYAHHTSQMRTQKEEKSQWKNVKRYRKWCDEWIKCHNNGMRVRESSNSTEHTKMKKKRTKNGTLCDLETMEKKTIYVTILIGCHTKCFNVVCICITLCTYSYSEIYIYVRDIL